MSVSRTYQTEDKAEPLRDVQTKKPPIKPKPIIPPRPKEILCPSPTSEIKNALLSPTLGPSSPSCEIPSALKITQLTGPQPYGTKRTSLKRWSSSVGDYGNQESNILSPVENKVSDLSNKVSTQLSSASLKPLQTGSVWKGKSPFVLTTRGWGEQRWNQEKETPKCESTSRKHHSSLTSKPIQLKSEEATLVEENVMTNVITSHDKVISELDYRIGSIEVQHLTCPKKSSTIFEDVVSTPSENPVSSGKSLHTSNVPTAAFKTEQLPNGCVTEFPTTSGRNLPNKMTLNQVTFEYKNTDYQQVKDLFYDPPPKIADTRELYPQSINAIDKQHSQNHSIANQQQSEIYYTNPTFKQEDYLTTQMKGLEKPEQPADEKADKDSNEGLRKLQQKLNCTQSEFGELANQESYRDHEHLYNEKIRTWIKDGDLSGNLETKKGENNNVRNGVKEETPDSDGTEGTDKVTGNGTFRENPHEDNTSSAPTEGAPKKEKKHEIQTADNNDTSISEPVDIKIFGHKERNSLPYTDNSSAYCAHGHQDINTKISDNILDEKHNILDKGQLEADAQMQIEDYMPHAALEFAHKQKDFSSEISSTRPTDEIVLLDSHESETPLHHNSGTMFQLELPEHGSIKEAPYLAIDNSNLPEEIYTHSKKSHAECEESKKVQNSYTETDVLNIIQTQPEMSPKEFTILKNYESRRMQDKDIQLVEQDKTGNESEKQQSTNCQIGSVEEAHRYTQSEEPFQRHRHSDSPIHRFEQSGGAFNTSEYLDSIQEQKLKNNQEQSLNLLQSEEPVYECEQLDESNKHCMQAEKLIHMYEPSESIHQYASNEQIHKNKHQGIRNEHLVETLNKDEYTRELTHHDIQPEDQTQRYETLESGKKTPQPLYKHEAEPSKEYVQSDYQIHRHEELASYEILKEPVKIPQHSEEPVCEQEQLTESNFKTAQSEEQVVSYSPSANVQTLKGLDNSHQFCSEEPQHNNVLINDSLQTKYRSVDNEYTITKFQSQPMPSLIVDITQNIPVEQHDLVVHSTGEVYVQKYLEQPHSYSNYHNYKNASIDDPLDKEKFSKEQNKHPEATQMLHNQVEQPQHCHHYKKETEHKHSLQQPRHTDSKRAEMTESHIESDGSDSEETLDTQVDGEDNAHLGKKLIHRHSELEEEHDADITSDESKLQLHTLDEIKAQDSEETNSPQDNAPAEASFDFLEGTVVLDSSYMRSRASLGKKRCRKTPIPGACTSEARDAEYWMFRDSTEPKCCIEKDSDDEEIEQTSPDFTPDNSPSERKPHTKKGGIFGGKISPSILKGRLKGRNKTTEVETAKPDIEEIKSPEKADSSSHSLKWLHVLKKKKKKQTK